MQLISRQVFNFDEDIDTLISSLDGDGDTLITLLFQNSFFSCLLFFSSRYGPNLIVCFLF